MKKIVFLLIALLTITTQMSGQNYSSHFENGINAAATGNYDQAKKEWTIGANLNDKFCCGRLGALYLYGLGVEKNIAEAEKWLQKGYKLENSYSAGLLGLLRVGNFENNTNLSRALPILEFSYLADDAEKENEEMYANMGITIAAIYCQFDNYEEGVEWAERTIKDYPDSPQANGSGSKIFYSTRDYVNAVKCATIADKKQNLAETFTLGLCMAYGYGIQKNEEAGFKKVRKVAYTEIDDEAMLELGNFYYNGIGTPIDKAEAKLWYEKAAKAGNEEAKEKLNMLY